MPCYGEQARKDWNVESKVPVNHARSGEDGVLYMCGVTHGLADRGLALPTASAIVWSQNAYSNAVCQVPELPWELGRAPGPWCGKPQV